MNPSIVAKLDSPVGLSYDRTIPNTWNSSAVSGSYVTAIAIGPLNRSGNLNGDFTLKVTYSNGSVATFNSAYRNTTVDIQRTVRSISLSFVYISGSTGEYSLSSIKVYGGDELLVDESGSIGINSSDPSMPASWSPNVIYGQYITKIQCGNLSYSGSIIATIKLHVIYMDGLRSMWSNADLSGQTLQISRTVQKVYVETEDSGSSGSTYITNFKIYGLKEEKPMPTPGAQIKFLSGLKSAYDLIATKDQNTLYFCTDTQQIFVGNSEYTKSLVVLNAAPTESTPGNIGQLYAYNGNLYACTAADSGVYTYTRVANVNDVVGSVTSVGAGAGLATAADDDNPITSTGTIVHAVPTGASTHSSTASATQTLDFGDTFDLETVDTDEFGHVTGFHTTTVTMPANPDTDTTYSISSSSEGTITLTPSEGSAETITINGWSDLAKKSELAAVFKFRGTVATVAALPTVADVGDVYHVTAANAEYVCVQASTTDPQADAVWEELGTDIDLSGYVQKVAGATAGNVANLTADGSISDSGFTIGTSVPADAVFTDTTYENATTAVAGLMSTADKIKLDAIEADADVNVIESISVASTAIAPDASKNVNIELTNFGLTVDAAELNQLDGKLATSGGVLTVDGNITGHAASASTATYDANGDQIDTTYAKLTDLQWQAF